MTSIVSVGQDSHGITKSRSLDFDARYEIGKEIPLTDCEDLE
ncbi:hypothetical protein ACFL2H_11015 [Planctomycetota bacterium]